MANVAFSCYRKKNSKLGGIAMSDVQEALQAILKVINTLPGGEKNVGVSPRRVVCISRDYGSGGEEISQHLATRLGVRVFDQEILNKISQRLDADPSITQALDAGIGHIRNLWLYSLLAGKDLSVGSYKHHLVNVVISLARVGGVIIGRGAHLILARSGALRVRIIGSLDVCAERVAISEHLDIEAARREVIDKNRRREAFIHDTFGEQVDDPRAFDVIINTDHVADLTKTADLLVSAIKMISPPKPVMAMKGETQSG